MLVVEDDAVNRNMALLLLLAVGLHVEVACDGAEALDMLERSDFRLVLMDVRIPVLNGMEVTRRIRKRRDRTQPVVLAFTANAFDEDRANCLASGMDDFIAKPVDPEGMYDTLLRWLEARAPRRH